MIPLFKVRMDQEHVGANLKDVLASGFIGQGVLNDRLETMLLKTFIGRTPVLTSSCTAAIHMVLTYLGVGPGDEVITTPLTCVATNAPILAVGARPVWADIDPVTGNIDPTSVRDKITQRTKAIIGVDWTGRKADYKTLRSFGIPVIQDAAHNPNIRADDRDCGDFICYSFGPIKHYTTGDGGAVVCEEKHRAALKLLRWYGLDRESKKDFRCEQDITVPGMKWHMNDINAAIGLGNIGITRATMLKHRVNAAVLHERINNPFVKVPPFDNNSGYWVFPLLVDERDKFKKWMEECGVMATQVHARNDKHTGYNFPSGPLPGVDYFDAHQINIPCGWWLDSADLDKIIEAVNSFDEDA